MTLEEHQESNRKAWQEFAESYVEPAEIGWQSNNPRWGIWQTPETQLNLLPDNLTGMKCLEIGCGAGYVSSWMARRGGQVTGIDPTPKQLETARRLEKEHDLGVKLIEAFGEELPFPDSTFDFGISEYGASLWADPYKWIPEAARVLKNGAQLIFMTSHPLAVCCEPDEGDLDAPHAEKLIRPYLGLYKLKWEHSSNETEFHLPHGELIELLRNNGFIIERLLEFGAPKKAESRYSWANPEWASKWPSEEVWCVRLDTDSNLSRS